MRGYPDPDATTRTRLVRRRYEVKIRYRGSREALVVHPGRLAIPPAEIIPPEAR
jgi:hypothetical protein